MRCGHAVNFTLDFDALETLRLLAPGRKAQGRFLSSLIREELVRRETRRETREQIARELQTNQP
jgi:hypothetical protein